MDRKVAFVLGLLASLALTALLWALGVPGLFLFLFLPFLWFPFARARDRQADPARACPSCGARVQRGFAFCPACGARL